MSRLFLKPNAVFLALLLTGWTLATIRVNAAEPRKDAAGDEFFEKSVRPLLVKHCYGCHSHAGGKMRGGLALDSRSGWEKGGDSGPAIVPGKAEKSLLIRAIRHTQGDPKMPPKEKLSDTDIKTLVDWVAQGATDPRVLVKQDSAEWWSLKPLVRPALPSKSPVHPIDAFIQARLQEKQLKSAPEADRRTLIRRLTFDLHGLPPTAEEVEAFVDNKDPQAYEKLVDRLLASPRYGERWARHWLDVVRYGDSNGNEHDGFREHAWRYRDYVIEAFNRDRPYDRFIQEQLAADALFPEDASLTAALGFLAAGPDVLSGSEYTVRDEFVTTAMTAFTSTTAHCARCHNHKFDPITLEDYYGLQAIFAGVQRRTAPVDLDPAIAKVRARWAALKSAASKRDRTTLLSDEVRTLGTAWEKSLAERGPRWKTLSPQMASAASGTTLDVRKDGSLLARKPGAATDTYTLTIPGPLGELKLLRLETLSDPGLPGGGPGLAEDGSFSLSELEVVQFDSGKDKGKKVSIRNSLSDEVDVFQFAPKGKDPKAPFELSTRNSASTRAHDNKEDTGWVGGGKSRTAVFELNGNVKVPEGGRLEIVLKQRQAKQLLGCFRFSVNDQSLTPYSLVPRVVAQAMALPSAKREESHWLTLVTHALPIVCEEELQKLPPQTSFYVVAGPLSQEGKSGTPKSVNILLRGDNGKSLGTAAPGSLSCVTGLKSRMDPAEAKEEAARRAYLARWLSDPKNSLTWRSIVNRVWHHHFGRGIVESLNDFGRMGTPPSHPDLLDWLACEFRDSGMSLKKLHRLILTSAAYRQAVVSNPAAEKIDVENRLLWRMNRNRLDAEAYRDTVLAVSGRLDLTTGGPGVLQFEVKPGFNTTKLANYDAVNWDAPGVTRRSVYRFIFRTRPDPFMSAMDFPDASQFVPSRVFSASPLQALVLFNSNFVLHHSDHLAKRITQHEKELPGQILQAFRLTLQRSPTAEESKDFGAYASRHGLAALCRILLNSNEFLFVE